MNSADRAERIERSGMRAGTARVIAFPGVTIGSARLAPADRPDHRFSIRDRIVALDWAEQALSLGLTRLTFEAAADLGGEEIDGDEPGEFILIYAGGAAWASWGIGCGADGMTLWHSPRGKTIGRFATLREALDQVTALSTAAERSET